jgi:GTP pyrophosphokinase
MSAAVEARRLEGEQFLRGVEDALIEQLRENNIDARVEWRIKRLYSIFQKIQRAKVSFDQVYDFLALRVITHDVGASYAVFGLIHSLWRPVPGRIKDFIAIPRANRYQSLHTTVIGEGGHQFEVQIRTEEMHKMAEEGIAAHWKYKDGSPVSAKDEKRLAWLRQVVEWQQDVKDPSEFLSTLKVDLYPEEVYTFTPKGKVVILPRDASAIDFAYAIHTEVGHTCVGARVNGRIVPLRCKLHNGDVVEIMTQAGHTPSRDWLAFTKSSRARNKIKHWVNVHQRERAIEIGKKLIEKLARKFQLSFKDFDEKQMEKVAREYGLSSGQDLLAGIGYGKFSARQILAKLSPQVTEEGAVPEDATKPAGALSSMIRRVFGQSAESAAIKVRGHDDLLVYRARCCNPIRGEAIVGYVTRGKGVAVHAISCSNVTNLMYEADRRIAVEWAKPLKAAGSSTYPVKLTVFCDDRAGMLKQLTAVVSDDNTNIRNIEARTADRQATIDMVIDIEDVKHLERLMAGLRKIPGIRDVQRLGKI